MNRRLFIKSSGATVAATCLCGAGFNACTMIQGVSSMTTIPVTSYTIDGNHLIIKLDQVPDLAKIGGSAKLASADHKIAIVKISELEFMVFENRCSHGGRELNYLADQQKIQCTSFGKSRYNLDGEVEKGPAPSPIKLYDSFKEAEQLTIFIT